MSSASCVLVINCGSSSLKFSLISLQSFSPILSGLAEKIGLEQASITFNDQAGKKISYFLSESTHQAALKVLFDELARRQLFSSVYAIGHRVAHGGAEFTQSVRINTDVIKKIRQLSALAPLHNPANLIGIEASLSFLPQLPQIAVFDTAFHQTLSPAAYSYAIPLEYQQRYQIRRYGFHGTSHRYIAKETVAMLGLNPTEHGILIAHLGNGSSVCAVKNGQSVDTSMGMTPLEGLVMGTRCGDIDFGALSYLAECTQQSLTTLYEMTNTQSGLLGLSGLSSDCRTLQKARCEGDPRATLAIDVMVHRLARHLGGHLTSLERLDALVFTGGIGENSALIRELVVQRLAILGLHMDTEKNQNIFGGKSGVISVTETPTILVLPTNEEKMIAQDVAAVVAESV